jgi:RNA polymerase sigma factor (sigma-70 family)
MSYENVINKYNGLIWSIVHRYSSKLNDKNDLYQECLFKLWIVFDDYNKEFNWSTYISNICKNHLHDIVKSENTLKRINHSTSGRMMKDLRLDSKEYNYLVELIINPKNKYTTNEIDILDRSMKILENNKHKDKIRSVLEGKTYKEVGMEYGVSKQYVYKIFKEFISE